MDRKRDLFYNIRIFSQAPFEHTRCGSQFKYKKSVQVSEEIFSGGLPNSPLFYKNPQFKLTIDKEFTNMHQASKEPFQVLLTY